MTHKPLILTSLILGLFGGLGIAMLAPTFAEQATGNSTIVPKTGLQGVARPEKVSAFARLRPKGGVRHLTGPAGVAVYRISEVFVEEGEMVTAGQPLVELDVKSERMVTRALAEAGVREAQINVDFARIELERKERLHYSATASVSKSGVDSAQKGLELADVKLRTAQLQLTHETILENQATIIAPVGGMILDVIKQPGEGAVAGEELIELGEVTQMEALAEVFETKVRFVKVGQQALFQTSALNAPVSGHVLRVIPKVEETTIYSTNALGNLEKRIVQVICLTSALVGQI